MSPLWGLVNFFLWIFMSLWKVITILLFLTILSFIVFRVVLNVENSNSNSKTLIFSSPQKEYSKIFETRYESEAQMCTVKCMDNKK